MDTVIDKLSAIEEAAAGIMEQTNERKKEYARTMQEKTAAFDVQLEKETAARIQKVRENMEADMNAKLKQQAEDSKELQKRIEDNYEQQHTAYAEALFQAMIKR